MEEYIKSRVEEEMEREIKELYDKLERRLPREEFRRVMEIAAGWEEHRGA